MLVNTWGTVNTWEVDQPTVVTGGGWIVTKKDYTRVDKKDYLQQALMEDREILDVITALVMGNVL